MLRGAFKRFDHDHYFSERDGVTVVRDVFGYQSPLGWLGRLADGLFLERYMRGFLVERNRIIKQAAETERWRQFLDSAASSR